MGIGRSCTSDCTCGRHFHRRGYILPPRSDAHRKALSESWRHIEGRHKPCEPNCRCGRHDPPPRSIEHRQNLSKALVGRTFPHHVEHGRRNWMGGVVGEVFSKGMIEAGFVREHVVYYDNNTRHAVMDLAHVALKIDIELDGIYHMATTEYDSVRDSLLSKAGWTVLRIQHD